MCMYCDVGRDVKTRLEPSNGIINPELKPYDGVICRPVNMMNCIKTYHLLLITYCKQLALQHLMQYLVEKYIEL